MKTKVYLSESECIDAIIYMCGKIGIEVRYDEMNSTYYCCIQAYELTPMFDVFSKAWDIQSTLNSINGFAWRRDIAKKTLVSFIAVKHFKIVGISLYIVNPFYNAFNILDAHSLYEVYVQIDLVCPENRSGQVFKEIEKKLQERKM